MLTAILAILCGLLLISDLLGERISGAVNWLKPFETVIGVIAIVVGILNITSVTGIALVLAGLILAISAIGAIPRVGGELQKAGNWLAQFRIVIGLIVLIIGIVSLFAGPGPWPWGRGPGGPPGGGPPGGNPPGRP
jgi:uncharacterized membrane protein HdeD (DUF308 family)